ncbi:hypothetical protein GCM10009844_13740 [Nocardioides koreensis]|uniref:Uncharacterized protein n=1 Tax=Nocardioides koreensis TaxID=433651 RepID=A0ABN2ZHV9_9ACTN
MSSMHPAIVEALARQHRAELLRAAELGGRRPAARTERRGTRSLAGLVDRIGLRRPAPVAYAPCC